MNKIYILLILTALTFLNVQFSFSQSYTSKSKSCGKCGKSVSANSKVGDTCPHCGVTWGRENTQTSTSIQTYPSSPSNVYINDNIYTQPSNPNVKSQPAKNKEEVDNSTASKTETENWILEKLKTNTPKKYYDNFDSVYGDVFSGWYNMNYNYSFDNYNLIVEYEEEQENKITKYKVKIPIYDIEKAYNYKGGLWISTEKETVIKYNLTENTKRVQSYFETDFNIYSETELCNRLHKAFLHLKKFYKKPTSTEPF